MVRNAGSDGGGKQEGRKKKKKYGCLEVKRHIGKGETKR